MREIFTPRTSRPRYRLELTHRQSIMVVGSAVPVVATVLFSRVLGIPYRLALCIALAFLAVETVVFWRVAWPNRVRLPRHVRREPAPIEADPLYAIHQSAIRSYVEQTWGWDDAQQYAFWREHWFPEREAIDVDGELAGFLDLEERDDHLWVGNLELHPRFQGQGMGTAILRDILRDAASRGLDVRLQVLKVNPARRLYESLGFEVTGETQTHYQMAWHPLPSTR